MTTIIRPAVLSLTVLALAPSTSAEPVTSTSPAAPPVDISWTAVEAPNTTGVPVCDGTSCVYPVSGARDATGPFVGRVVVVGAGAPRPGGGYSGLSFRLFEGEFAPCGVGTMMLEESITTDDGVALRGEWRIIVGGGTGALAATTGGGTFVGTGQPDGTITIEADGQVVC